MKLLHDVESSAYEAVKALDYRRYLVAMVVVSDVLTDLRWHLIPQETASTTLNALEYLRETARRPEDADRMAALKHYRRLRTYAVRLDGPRAERPGLDVAVGRLWSVMCTLLAELVQPRYRYSAVGSLGNAFVPHPDDGRGKPFIKLTGLAVDTEDPEIKLLQRCQVLAELTVKTPDSQLDPLALKQVVFGHRTPPTTL